MSDTTKSVIFLIALFIGLPLLILWMRDRVSRAVWRRRNPPKKVAADRRAYEERILRPDWTFYERHLQRPAPTALRELYSDRALVTAQGLEYTDADRISTFEPLDEQGLLDTRPWLGFDAVAIATSDFGDPIYLRPGSSEADTVYITHHDGGDTEVFAESVAAMVEKVRRPSGANWMGRAL
jgi:hypothetical protein